MNILNKVAGGVIGFATGILTSILKIFPYGYYVFARTLQEEQYPLPVIILATPIAGSIAVACTIPFVIVNAFGTVFTGMRTGWNKGIIGALLFPSTLGSRLNAQHQDLENSGIFSRLKSELGHLASAGTNYNSGNVKPKVDKNALRQKILSLPETEILSKTTLNQNEIDRFLDVIKTIKTKIKTTVNKDKEDALKKLQEIEMIERYITRSCVITRRPFLHLDKHKPGAVSCIPITLEYTDKLGKKEIYTYNYKAFQERLEKDLQDDAQDTLYAHTGGIQDIRLDDENVKIYRGYYTDLDDYVRDIINERENEQKKYAPESESESYKHRRPATRPLPRSEPPSRRSGYAETKQTSTEDTEKKPPAPPALPIKASQNDDKNDKPNESVATPLAQCSSSSTAIMTLNLNLNQKRNIPVILEAQRCFRKTVCAIVAFLTAKKFSNKENKLSLEEKKDLKNILEIMNVNFNNELRQIKEKINMDYDNPEFLLTLAHDAEANELFKEMLITISRQNQKLIKINELLAKSNAKFLEENKHNQDEIIAFTLTPEELDNFSNAVKEIRDKGNKTQLSPEDKKSIALDDYLTTCCPITFKPLQELHKCVVQGAEASIVPITIEYASPTGQEIYTYNCYAFEQKWFEDLEDDKRVGICCHMTGAPNITFDNENVTVYRGYYKGLDVEHIRQVGAAWKQAQQAPQQTASSNSVYSPLRP